MTSEEGVPTPTFHDPSLLADGLRKDGCGSKNFFIGIDGKDGSGKSRLAIELSKILPARVIELDNYTEKHQDRYVSALSTNELQRTINQATGIVILEGVCLLAVLNKLGIDHDALIYVKRVHRERWMDEDICSPLSSAEEIIKKKQADQLNFLKSEAAIEKKLPPTPEGAKLSGLTEEIIRYHAEFDPLEHANYIYEAKHA